MRNKFRKLVIGIMTLTMVLGTMFIATGCNRIQTVFAWYEGDNAPVPQILVMHAGEELTVSDSQFADVDVYFERFELEARDETRKNVLVLDGNTATATNSGFAMLIAILYEEIEQSLIRAWMTVIARVYVIDEGSMTHITTAEELANINNNLDGHFILMNDIYLADDWDGDWLPIGRRILHHQEREEHHFTGMFVNPHGHKIHNLNITTSEDENGTIRYAGLFGSVYDRALIYGIILEELFIDVSDFEWLEPIGSPVVGAIASTTSRGVVIKNCFVSGDLVGGGYATGGIVGINQNSFILYSEFNGSIYGPQKGPTIGTTGVIPVGGIAGAHYVVNDFGSNWSGYIRGCIVNVNIINGFDIAATGGIVGYNGLDWLGMSNNIFTGDINGPSGLTGSKIGYDVRTRGPVDFKNYLTNKETN